VSVLGILLRGNPKLQQSVVTSALRDFPVIGDQISKNIHSLSGSGVARSPRAGAIQALRFR